MEASNYVGTRGVLGENALLRWVRKRAFLHVHVAYFVVWAMVGALELWMSPKPRLSPPLSFIDALFNAVSAVTETGLSSVAMHRFSLSDQLTLLLLMVVGSQVFTSAIALFLRRIYSTTSEPHSSLSYPHDEEELISSTLALHEAELSQRKDKEGIIRRALSMPILGNQSPHILQETTHSELGNIGSPAVDQSTSKNESMKSRGSKDRSISGGGHIHTTSVTISPSKKLKTEEDYSGGGHIHTNVTTSPSKTLDGYINGGLGHIYTSVTISPSKNQLEPEEEYIHRKAMEDKALVAMSWVTIFYYVACVMVGFLISQICILCSSHASGVLAKNQVNSSLFSLFSVVSAFGNNGLILLDENLEAMQREGVMVVCLALLILMGNTLYAPTLRGVIWVLCKGAKGERKQVYGYILKGTGRRYTHMFPRKETIWLVGTVVFINAFQMICILGFDWGSQALQGLGPAYKLLAALFQSISTRSAGMNVVSLSSFSSSTLFLSLAAMYFPAYPVYAVGQHKRKVFNGIITKSNSNMFVQQFCKLRAQDLFLFVAIFLICIFERDSIKNDSINFSFFNIVFEVISGYGNVGLSIGYNCKLRTVMTSTSVCMDIPCSLSGKWSVSSKMVLILVMLSGRHRGLHKT